MLKLDEMGNERLTLRAGELELDVLPRLGGSIASFDRISGAHRQSLLRNDGGTARHALDAGCFPMVPYVNRIRGGSFACDGRMVHLTANMPGDSSPLHGQGWLRAWEVVEVNAQRASLRYRHAADEWPWDYDAHQQIALDADGLSLTLSCTNRSPERMPCGLGFHPYYPCDEETVIDTQVTSVWTVDAAVLPVANVPAEGRYNLRNRQICGQSLDNGFDGWSGTADICWPAEEVGLRLSSPDAGRFQVYSPASGGLFVAEPVQNANAALNGPQEHWSDLGITLLQQGETSSVRARFELITS
jgi:aldose 1-epimerase